MDRKLGWIRQFHKPESPDSPLLLIFPHAGAGASAYRTLSKALAAKFNVIIFQYPGRQDRAGEPALASLADIAAGAFAEFQSSDHRHDVPIYTFGHSMGAVVSFEFVRLAEAAGHHVHQLTVSSAVAPGNIADKPPLPTDDDSVLAHMGALEGTNSTVMANLDVMRMALPVMKGDYQAFNAYTCPADIKVAARIHSIGGDQDPMISMRDLYGWGQHTDTLDVTLFDGGHFYLNTHIEALADLMASGAAHTSSPQS
ncbi:thioesterase [Mycobacterium sp. CBMA271]|uniref:thioesterase II family protein n=1 Tax=unclassified Mycobacteroides TaxID=2618759 RepID=UPI0013275C9C|nr:MULTISPECIES: alpha/beta fold hydrolase [unclassified Mycobacteroides]MUM18703.1 thioesterase [Mycobacteroides sp. CBMA 326]MUM22665.1 thioesterase [Mycobacteroides sp. CBMA 271]